MSAPKSNERWYPSQQQVKDPDSTQRALRRILDLHYNLLDQHNELKKQVTPTPTAQANTTSTGPASQQFLGLPVAPVNTQTLADGATLKWSKANGHFTFS